MEFGRRICSTLGVLWHNAFAPVRKMPTTPWENGRELLHIPYAETSENQYLDLYLPDCSEKLPLLVLIHGGGFAGTVQAFVPLNRVEDFKQQTEAVLGENACHIMAIRPVGGIRLA